MLDLPEAAVSRCESMIGMNPIMLVMFRSHNGHNTRALPHHCGLEPPAMLPLCDQAFASMPSAQEMCPATSTGVSNITRAYSSAPQSQRHGRLFSFTSSSAKAAHARGPNSSSNRQKGRLYVIPTPIVCARVPPYATGNTSRRRLAASASCNV